MLVMTAFRDVLDASGLSPTEAASRGEREMITDVSGGRQRRRRRSRKIETGLCRL